MSEINESLQRDGFETTITSGYSLWSSVPDQFSLIVNANLPGKNVDTTCYSSANIEYVWSVVTLKEFKEAERVFFGLIKKRELVYIEVPRVQVSGRVDYERLKEVEPTPVLNTLNTLGYNSVVIPTSREIEESVESIRH